MVTNNIIKGISNAKGNKEVTNKRHAKDHDKSNQKHGTHGKSTGNGKGKYKDNMEDVEIKRSKKKGPKGLSDIQGGEHVTKLANMAVLDKFK